MRDPLDLRPPLEVGIHGVHRHRDWDTVQTVAENRFRGNDLQFVVLPDGTPVIESDEPPGTYAEGWEGFADAIRRELEPPFRARAVRRERGFVVGARSIDVAELRIEGDELTLRASAAERELRVDGWPAVAGTDDVERAVASRFPDYFVFARRLSGTFWEIELTPL